MRSEEIRKLNGIKVVETTEKNLSKTGLHGDTFQLTAHRVQTSSSEFIAAEIVHESAHIKQWKYDCESAIEYEKKASAFTLGVIKNLGFGVKAQDAFQEDALRGHVPPGCKKKAK